MSNQKRILLVDGLVEKYLGERNFGQAEDAALISGRKVRPQELMVAALKSLDCVDFRSVLSYMHRGMHQRDKNFLFVKILAAEEFQIALQAIREKIVSPKKKDVDLIVFYFIKFKKLKDALSAAKLGATKKCLNLLLNHLIKAGDVVCSLEVAKMLDKKLSLGSRKKILHKLFNEEFKFGRVGVDRFMLANDKLDLDLPVAYDMLIKYFIGKQDTCSLENMIYDNYLYSPITHHMVITYFEKIKDLGVLENLDCFDSVKKIALSCLKKRSLNELWGISPGTIAKLKFSEREHEDILSVLISQKNPGLALKMFDGGFSIDCIDQFIEISTDLSVALNFAKLDNRPLTNNELKSFL
jgi:hypothetical protein